MRKAIEVASLVIIAIAGFIAISQAISLYRKAVDEYAANSNR